MTRIVPLTYRHCSAIARLHLSHLRSRFSGLPGEQLLRSYYMTVADGVGACGYVAESDNKVIGYICGIWEPHALRAALLKKRWFELIVWALVQVFVAPRLLIDLGRRVFVSPSSSRVDSGYELRPIVVISSARGTGVSTALVNTLLSDAAQRGMRSIWLLTETDNMQAKAFYSKVGFVKTGLFERAGVSYTRYEYAISEQ